MPPWWLRGGFAEADAALLPLVACDGFGHGGGLLLLWGRDSCRALVYIHKCTIMTFWFD
jgi:hypothetical protein